MNVWVDPLADGLYEVVDKPRMMHDRMRLAVPTWRWEWEDT